VVLKWFAYRLLQNLSLQTKKVNLYSTKLLLNANPTKKYGIQSRDPNALPVTFLASFFNPLLMVQLSNKKNGKQAQKTYYETIRNGLSNTKKEITI
jgi:hypothetical protein